MSVETTPATGNESQGTTPETPDNGTTPTVPTPSTDAPNNPEPADIAAKLASAEKRIHELNQENAKRRKDAEAAEKNALAEQGKFKELFEKSEQEREQLRADLSAKERAMMVQTVGVKFNIPEELRDRLRGETAEELEADAKGLAKFAGPKREAPPSEAIHRGASDAVVDEDYMKKVAREMGMKMPV